MEALSELFHTCPSCPAAERDAFGVYDLSDSKVVRYRLYDSRTDALEAAGLRE